MSQKPAPQVSLEAVNTLTLSSFIEMFGGVLKNSPHLAARLWHLRPFDSLEDMHEAVWKVVHALPNRERLDLIRRYPGPVPEALPQRSAGKAVDAGEEMDPENLDLLQRLAANYQRKFSFPYVSGPESGLPAVLTTLQQRLQHKRAEEVCAALTEICEMAGRQLAQRITA